MATAATDDDVRAAYYAAEAAYLSPPRLLPDLLRPGVRGAEVPSAYLPESGGSEASAGALAGIHRLPSAHRDRHLYDLVLSPNAALNMAATTPGGLNTAVRALANVMTPGGSVLAQVMCIGLGHPCDNAPFYTPGQDDSRWIEDRRFTVGRVELVRHRRQRRVRGRVHVDIIVRSGGGTVIEHTIDLRILTMREIRLAVADAGLLVDQTARGGPVLTELVLRRAHTTSSVAA